MTQMGKLRSGGGVGLPVRSLGWQFGLSAYWFATSMKWYLLLLVVIPEQVKAIVPGGEKNHAWATVFMIGAIWATIGPALFGYLSDRTRSRFGKWRPYLAIGSGLTVVALVTLANAQHLWVIVVGYLLVQLSDDIGTGPYSSLVPALVREEQRGRASGVMGLLQVTAQIAGTVVALALGGVAAIYAALAIVNVVCAAITLAAVRDEPPARTTPGGGFLQGWLQPWRSPDFTWVWLTRALVEFGFRLVTLFLLYYLGDVVRDFHFFGVDLAPIDATDTDANAAIAKAAFSATIVLGLVVSVSGALGAVTGGRLADRIGRKRVAILATALMALAVPPFVLLPVFTAIVFLALLFGLGYGAYQSASWALASDVMPSREDLAKDMGVWQASVATPQIFTGAIGLVLDFESASRFGFGYTAIFVFAGLAFAAGTVLIRRIRGSF